MVTATPSAAEMARRTGWLARLRRAARLALLRWARAVLPPPPRPPVGAAGRVLVIRPDHIGDVLMSTPALRLLRRALPEAEITALVGPWSARVLAGNPNVDRVLEVPFPGFARAAPEPGRFPAALRPYLLLIEWAAQLRRGRFDLAINLRRDFWWGALLAYAAGIPLRVGYRAEECLPFLNRRLRYRPGEHHVTRSLRLVAAAVDAASELRHAARAFHPEFYPTPEDEVAAAALLAKLGMVELRQPAASAGPAGSPAAPVTHELVADSRATAFGNSTMPPTGHVCERPLIAIQPGSGGKAKLWSAVAWAHVCQGLAALGARVILTGSPAERDLCAAVVAALRMHAIDGDAEAAVPPAGRAASPCHRAIALQQRPPPDRGPAGCAGSPRHRAVPLRQSAADCEPANRPGPPRHPDEEPCQRIEVAPVNLAGRTSLGVLAALFARCDLVLGVDSGALHLAAAMGTPTVTLFGPTNPATFRPWGDPAHHLIIRSGVPCSPCGHVALCPLGPDRYTCMPLIHPDTVLAAARTFLRWGPLTPPPLARR